MTAAIAAAKAATRTTQLDPHIGPLTTTPSPVTNLRTSHYILPPGDNAGSDDNDKAPVTRAVDDNDGDEDDLNTNEFCMFDFQETLGDNPIV